MRIPAAVSSDELHLLKRTAVCSLLSKMVHSDRTRRYVVGLPESGSQTTAQGAATPY